MTETEKAKAGFLYNPNEDKELMANIAKSYDLCYEYNKLRPSDTEGQNKILKKLFGKMGKNVTVCPPFCCDLGYKITMGDNFFANTNCRILDEGTVTFGDNVFIASNCTFTTSEHAIDAVQRNQGFEVALPIKIGNNVWIGAGSIILAGVTIGDNTVIGAGSVVKKSIPANVVAVGIPCKVLREITEEDKNRYPVYTGE